MSVTSLSSVEGAPFSGKLATFQDVALKGPVCAPASEYATAVDWGDQGRDAPTATLVSGPDQSGMCTYEIDDSHAYAEEGKYTVEVSVTGPSSATPGQGSGQASVDDAALNASSLPVDTTSGSQFTGTVASFADADPAGTATDYTVTIDWGDGASSGGTISAISGEPGQPGATFFEVTGTHTWTSTGNYTVTVKVTDSGAGTSTSFAAIVSRPVLFGEAAAWALHNAFNSGWMGGRDPALPPYAFYPIDRRMPVVHPRVSARRVRAGALVTFDASNVTMRLGRILRWEWDTTGAGLFDDGSGPRIATAFSTPGRHVVRVLVVRTQGPDAVVSMPITVVGGPPTATQTLLARMPLRGDPSTSFARGAGAWSTVGRAFRVDRRAAILESQLLNLPGTVGGSYADFYVPLGIPARQYETSFAPARGATGLVPEATGDLATGLLLSPRFVIRRRYLSLWLGGDEHGAKPNLDRVEIWVRPPSRARFRLVATLPAGASQLPTRRFVDMGHYRGDQAEIVAVDGSAAAHLSLASVSTSSRLPRGATVRAIRALLAAPLPGFADLHAHLMSHLASGALQLDHPQGDALGSSGTGIRTTMGVPGGELSTYLSGASSVQAYQSDVWRSDFQANGNAHFGQFALGPRVVNMVEGNGLVPDNGHGYPFPPDHGPLYEQMHVTELWRAHQGGMNLMSVLAVTNRALEYMMSVPYGGACCAPGHFMNQTGDSETILATVEATQELARLNSSWMQVVYTPAQARAAILTGKLALVLGVEVADLGGLVDIDPTRPSRGLFHSQAGQLFASPDQEVEWLSDIGIRQVIPIHSIDNSLGSTAIFQDAYNVQNELEHRPPGTSGTAGDIDANRNSDCFRRAGTDWLAVDDPFAGSPGACPHPYGSFYSVSFSDSCARHPVAGECVTYRLTPQQQMLDTSSDAGFAHAYLYPMGFHPFSVTSYRSRQPSDPPHAITGEDPPQGMTNSGVGLTPRGMQYISALMDHGMLLDIEHMSDSARQALMNPNSPLYRSARKSLHPRKCSPADTFFSFSGRLCMTNVYPVLSSHTTFRAQSAVSAAEKAFTPNEQQRTPAEVDFIRSTGGLVAPVVLEAPRITVPGGSTFPAASRYPPTAAITTSDYRLHSTRVVDDCPGSSTGFAAAYQYAIQKMGGRGVALGDDMWFVGGTSPRFPLEFTLPNGQRATVPQALPTAFNPPDRSMDPIPHATAAHGTPIAYPNNCREWRTVATDAGLSDATKLAELRGPTSPPSDLDGASFNFGGQHNPVDYASPRDPTFWSADGRDPLGLMWPEERPGAMEPSDFNNTGLDTIGKLPDLLQDTINVGVDPQDMAPLFHSAEDYVEMWEKAQRVGGCTSHPDRCPGLTLAFPHTAQVCRFACPLDPGRGLEDDSTGHRRTVLDPLPPAAGFVLPPDG